MQERAQLEPIAPSPPPTQAKPFINQELTQPPQLFDRRAKRFVLETPKRQKMAQARNHRENTVFTLGHAQSLGSVA